MKETRLQVGVDISKHKLDLCMLTAEGQVVVRHRSFPNSADGYRQLRETLLNAVQAGDYRGIDVGGESTGYYWLPFFLQLAGDADLRACNLQTYLVNARQVHWFKKGYAEAEKTDEKDSFYVAEKLRTQQDKYPWQADTHWRRLRFYSRYRFHLGQQLTRVKNYFWAHMFLLCNRYGAGKPFSDGLGACGRTLVREYADWQSLLEIPPEQLGVQLETWSRHHLPDPAEHAQHLQEVIRESFPVHPELAQALHDLLTMTLDHLDFIEKQIVQVERLMRQQVQQHHPEVRYLMSIKGIGLVLAVGIACEIGDLQRFFDGQKWDRRKKRYRNKNLRDVEDAVAKFAGLWWPRNQSGGFRSEERRLSKQGNRYLRYYLVEAADKLRQYLPEYRTYYQRKYQEVNKHPHKRALVLTARKSVGLFVGLLHRNEPYRSPEGRRA